MQRIVTRGEKLWKEQGTWETTFNVACANQDSERRDQPKRILSEEYTLAG